MQRLRLKFTTATIRLMNEVFKTEYSSHRQQSCVDEPNGAGVGNCTPSLDLQ